MLFARLILALSFALSLSPTALASVDSFETVQVETLPDLLSPDELAEELGLPNQLEAVLPFLSQVQPPRLQFIIDKALQGTSLTAQTVQVYLDGQLLYNWLASTGREQNENAKSGKKYFSSTPVGTFKITRRHKDYFSKTWQAPMPYAQFFNGGIAIHGTSENYYGQLGSRASGGCVRLTLENAKTAWDLVDEAGVQQTQFIVIDGSAQ